ncbi:hypothetical protein PHMEG_00036683, partial [Phytophthora megakarya]
MPARSTVIRRQTIELRNLIWAIKLFRPYLYGRRFVIPKSHRKASSMSNYPARI